MMDNNKKSFAEVSSQGKGTCSAGAGKFACMGCGSESDCGSSAACGGDTGNTCLCLSEEPASCRDDKTMMDNNKKSFAELEDAASSQGKGTCSAGAGKFACVGGSESDCG